MILSFPPVYWCFLDLEECKQEPNPCEANNIEGSVVTGVCDELPGSYQCKCANGYWHQDNDKTKCVGMLMEAENDV